MKNRPRMPEPQRRYGRVIYALTLAACIVCIVAPLLAMLRPQQNVLDPYFLFARIFEGAPPAEVWGASGGAFPGGHFYLRHPLSGDGLAHFGLAAIGCSSAAWALLAAAFGYVRARDRLFAAMSLFVVLLVLLAMSGLVGAGG